MSLINAIGWMILSLPFLALFIFVALKGSLKEAVGLSLCTAFLVFLFHAGYYLTQF